MQLPGEEAAIVLLQVVAPDAVKKGADRLIGWCALSASASGHQHLQLRAPPLPTSAATARKDAGADALDVWIHLNLSTAVTGTVARVAARAADHRATKAQRAGVGRARSVFFDPHALPAEAPPTIDYIAPLTSGDAAGLLAAIVNTPAAVTTVRRPLRPWRVGIRHKT